MREPADFDERRRADLLPEILLAKRREIRAVAHVGHVRRDLHDVRHRAALGFDEPFDRLERAPRLRLEIAAKRGAAVLLVRDLTGEKQDGLAVPDFHALAVT